MKNFGKKIIKNLPRFSKKFKKNLIQKSKIFQAKNNKEKF